GEPLIREVANEAASAALTRAAFEAILDGQTPRLDDLVQASSASPRDVERLLGRGLILDEHKRVVAAHGLSLVPARQHRLTMRGGQFWTWCAMDAIGIPAGLCEDALAETKCLQCGTPVRITLRAGEIVDTSHPTARVWEAQRLEGCGNAGPPHCA